MLGKSTKFIRQFASDESGQGIVEYGAILAFVAVLVGVLFTFGGTTLATAVTKAFQTVINQLNNLSNVGG